LYFQADFSNDFASSFRPDWLSIGKQAHPEGKYIISDSLIE
jgi:hypothetical protein